MLKEQGILLVLALSLLGGAGAPQEEDGDEDFYTFAMGDGGMSPGAFINLASQLTRRPITYDSEKLGEVKRFIVVGEARIPESRIGCYMEEIFAAQGLNLQPLNDEPSGLMVLENPLSVLTSRTKARAIDAKDLSRAEQQPAGIFSTIIPLSRAKASEVVQAFEYLTKESRLGSVIDLPASNSVAVLGSGHFVVACATLIRELETAGR